MRVTENIFKYKEVVVKKSHGYTQVWLFTNSPSRNAIGVKVCTKKKELYISKNLCLFQKLLQVPLQLS